MHYYEENRLNYSDIIIFHYYNNNPETHVINIYNRTYI